MSRAFLPTIALPRLVAALVGALALSFAAFGTAEAAPARTTADLNMRSGPGTQFRIVTSIPRGTLVDLGRCVPGWCEVAWRGRVGWASSRFLVEGGRPQRPTRPRPEPAPPFGFPFPVPIPGPGFEPPRPGPAWGECRVRPARWLIGERATERRLDAALEDSGARTLRVEQPGRFYTQDYREDRLVVQVDRDGWVVDVECR